MSTRNSIIISLGLVLGLCLMAMILSKGMISYKELDRTVVVKGLAQKEVRANLVIWPIKFVEVSNDNIQLYEKLQYDTNKILTFLEKFGFSKKELNVLPHSIVDRFANSYTQTDNIKYRYNGSRKIVVYSDKIELAKKAMKELSVLGKDRINFIQNDYETRVDYLFTKLNELKPKMIEQATQSARKTAQKFAQDSNSNLGKIKKASQGQFSIQARDNNTNYIKKIRVVSTIEYYLVD